MKGSASRASDAWSDKTRGTVGWITRNQAADLLGISPMSLILWERKGRIVPKTAFRHDARGCLCEQVVYDPAAIIQLPRKSLRPVAKDPDEFAARAVELFEQGMNDRDIVMELRATFEKVAAARANWLDAGGACRVIMNEHADALTELVGPFETVAELVELVRTALSSRRPEAA